MVQCPGHGHSEWHLFSSSPDAVFCGSPGAAVPPAGPGAAGTRLDPGLCPHGLHRLLLSSEGWRSPWPRVSDGGTEQGHTQQGHTQQGHTAVSHSHAVMAVSHTAPCSNGSVTQQGHTEPCSDGSVTQQCHTAQQ